MATYGEIRTKFLARLNRRDCTTTLADGFLQDAMRRSQRVLRVPAMETSLAVTLDATNYGTDGVLYLPADYVKLREITVNDEYSLQRRPLDYVLQTIAAAGQGQPLYYARRFNGLVFAPDPTLDSYEVRIDYYAEFENLDDADDDTVISDIAEDLLVYGALAYACDHWSDKRGPRFEERYLQILSDLQNQADTDELTEASVQQAFAYPSDD